MERYRFLYDFFPVLGLLVGLTGLLWVWPVLRVRRGAPPTGAMRTPEVFLPVVWAGLVTVLFWTWRFEPLVNFVSLMRWPLILAAAAGAALWIRYNWFFVAATVLAALLLCNPHFVTGYQGWFSSTMHDGVYYQTLGEYLKEHPASAMPLAEDWRFSSNIVRHFLREKSFFRLGHSVLDGFVAMILDKPAARTVFFTAMSVYAMAIGYAATVLRTLFETSGYKKYVAITFSLLLVLVMGRQQPAGKMLYQSFFPAVHGMAMIVMVPVFFCCMLQMAKDDSQRVMRLFSLSLTLLIAAALLVYPEMGLYLAVPGLAVVAGLLLYGVPWRQMVFLIASGSAAIFLAWPGVLRAIKALSVISGLKGHDGFLDDQWMTFLGVGTKYFDQGTVYFIVFISLLPLGLVIWHYFRSRPTHRLLTILPLWGLLVAGLFSYLHALSSGNGYIIRRSLTLASPAMILLTMAACGALKMPRRLLAILAVALIVQFRAGFDSSKSWLRTDVLTSEIFYSENQWDLIDRMSEGATPRELTMLMQPERPDQIHLEHFLTYLEILGDHTVWYRPFYLNYGHPEFLPKEERAPFPAADTLSYHILINTGLDCEISPENTLWHFQGDGFALRQLTPKDKPLSRDQILALGGGNPCIHANKGKE